MNNRNKFKLLVAILIILTPIICDNIVFLRDNHMEMKYIFVSLVVSSIIGLRYIYNLLDK